MITGAGVLAACGQSRRVVHQVANIRTALAAVPVIERPLSYLPNEHKLQQAILFGEMHYVFVLKEDNISILINYTLFFGTFFEFNLEFNSCNVSLKASISCIFVFFALLIPASIFSIGSRCS